MTQMNPQQDVSSQALEQPPTAVVPADEASEKDAKSDTEVAVTLETLNSVSKRLTIRIPEEKTRRQYAAVLKRAQNETTIPGFRRGRVPPRLLEKRLGVALREDVRNRLVSEAIENAVKEHALKPVGEPRTDPPKIELPDHGPLDFAVEMEVAPEFPLPDLTQFEITKPLLEATNERFELALEHLRRNLGHWEDSPSPAANDDRVVADMRITGEDGALLGTHNNVILPVQAGTIAGIRFDDLAERLNGARPGAEIQLAGTVPNDHIQENIRGRKLAIALTIKQVQRLKVPELNDEMARENGFDSLEDMHNSMRQALQERLAAQIAQIMRDQMSNQLLEKIPLQVPPLLASRLVQFIVRRRAAALVQRGVPPAEVHKRIQNIADMSISEALLELTMFFILSRLAEQFDIDVGEDEIHAEVASLAAVNGQRPEKLRQELLEHGQLETLAIQIRDRKVLDRLVSQSKVREVDEEQWTREVKERREKAQSAAETASSAPDSPASDPNAT